MNWLIKLAKKMEISNIPWQILSSLIHVTENREWKLNWHQRNWNVFQNERPVFHAMFSCSGLRQEMRSGQNLSISANVHVYWSFPVGMSEYETTVGSPGLEFFRTSVKTGIRTDDEGPKLLGTQYAENLDTPFEIAQWVNEIIEQTDFGFGGNDKNDDDNGPDITPWPYDEGKWTQEEEQEEDIRGVRQRKWL